MLIGSKNLEIYSNVVPTVHNFALLPPNEPILGNDNTSPICSPNGVWAAQAAFAPRVANAKFFVSSDEWDVWQCEPPVSNMKHNKFGTNSESSRRQQNVLLVRSKRAGFHAIRVSSPCTAEGQQWIGRISENEGPRFVCVPDKWYGAHLQSMQPMKQLHQNSGDAEKWEPPGLPKSICWHDTTLPLNYECLNSLHTNNGVKLRVLKQDAGTQMAWLHDQCCRIKEHASGSPTSTSSCIQSLSR